MIGGYFSFQGIDGKARWHRTVVEDALPVTCLPYDDRLEIPEGFRPVINAEHAILPTSMANGRCCSAPTRVVARKRDDVEVPPPFPTIRADIRYW